MARPSATAGKGFGDCLRYLIGRSYEGAVRQMGVARRHAGYRVTQQPRDGQFREPQLRGCRGIAMAQDVDRDPIEAHSGANTVQYLGQADEMPVALVCREDPRALFAKWQTVQEPHRGTAERANLRPALGVLEPDALMAPSTQARGSASASIRLRPDKSRNRIAATATELVRLSSTSRSARPNARISSRLRNRHCLPSGRRRTSRAGLEVMSFLRRANSRIMVSMATVRPATTDPPRAIPPDRPCDARWRSCRQRCPAASVRCRRS